MIIIDKNCIFLQTWDDQSPEVLDCEYLEENEESVKVTMQTDYPCKKRTSSTSEEILKQDISETPLISNKGKSGLRRTSASVRYDTSIKQTDQLCEISRDDCESRKQFYSMKLKLYQQELQLKERSVIAKERLCFILEEYLRK